MASVPSAHAPGRYRRWFRRYRSVLLLPVLFILGTVVYFNQVGLPEFLKGPLVRELEQRGLRLEFDRLRLRWQRGLVAERVVLAESQASGGPEVFFDQVVLEPEWGRLLRFQFHLRSVRLRNGRLALPLDAADPSAPPFQVDSVQAELRFLPGDLWQLSRFDARGLGLSLQASGFLTNASAVREWGAGVGLRDRGGSLTAWQAHLRRIAAYARLWRFGRPPTVVVLIAGDARDPAGIRADARVEAESIASHWGTLESLALALELNRPAGMPGSGKSVAWVEFQGARTAWGRIARGRWDLKSTQAFTNLLPAEVAWQLELHGLESPWGEIPQIRFDLRAYQHPEFDEQLVGELSATSDTILGNLGRAETNRLTAKVWLDPFTYLPTGGEYEFRAANVRFREGTARAFELRGDVRIHEAETRATVDADWSWWGGFAPFDVTCVGRIEGLELRGVGFDTVGFEADWSAPRLHLGRFALERPGGRLEGSGTLDVATRQVGVTASMNLDAHALEPLLTPRAVKWLGQYGWEEPPQVHATLRLVLPPWRQTGVGWHTVVMPTFELDGRVQAGRATYRGVPADAVELRFIHTNGVWHLPRLVATRPEGRLELTYTEDTATRDYHFVVDSRINPQALRPLLGEQGGRALDLFDFRQPPQVRGEAYGRWRTRDRFGFHGQLESTRFVFRAEPVDELSATVSFTNRWLSARAVQLRAGDETVIAPGVGFSLADQELFLTNVTARMDPQRVARAIGPKTARILEPYRFVSPPHARVEGSVNVRQTRLANLRFDVSGGPFHYWRFRLPEVQAAVQWTNDLVTIDAVQAPFYGGQLEGKIRVNVGTPDATPFQFEGRAERADFHALLVDLLLSPTNRVEGLLNVELSITQALAQDWQSWHGFGRTELTDGFLWDIPMVGVLSPVLDSLLPGIGKSRITGATATFNITNSIIRTDDLELRAPLFRLAYKGSTDFAGRLDARVEGRILRDAWLVGPLVSMVFSPLTKMLEYRVTGTLGDPDLELLYIPKPLQVPLNPLGTIRDMFRRKPSQIPPPGL